MKKILYLLAVVLMFSSCDDYLDITPKGKIVPTIIDDLQSLMNTEWFIGSNETNLLVDLRAPLNSYQITGYSNPIQSYNFYSEEPLKRYEEYSNFSTYGDLYGIIAKANVVLSELSNVKGTEQEKAEMTAKCKTLRAYIHFLVANTYAKPYTGDPNQNGIIYMDEFKLTNTPAQSSLNDAYAKILKDLESISDLPVEKAIYTDITKDFGHALKAKVHLVMGDFDLAEQEALNSLALNSEVSNLVEYIKTDMSTPASFLPENLFVLRSESASSYTGFNRSFVEKFEEGDARKDVGLIFPTEYWYLQGVYKYETNGKYKPNTGGLKTTENYLILAECYARKGDFTGAVEMLDKIRTKRIKNPKTLKFANDVEAIHYIIDERAREYMEDFHRLIDIKRLSGTKYNKDIYKSTEYLGELIEVHVKSDSEFLTVPFPEKVELQHPELVHNTVSP